MSKYLTGGGKDPVGARTQTAAVTNEAMPIVPAGFGVVQVDLGPAVPQHSHWHSLAAENVDPGTNRPGFKFQLILFEHVALFCIPGFPQL